MQTVYIVLMLIMLITLIMEAGCIFEHRHFFHKYKRSIKAVCDIISVLTLCAISVVGCVETVNINIHFLVFYIAFYFLVKEIYTALIINRREKSIKIKLQSNVEKTIKFNEFFLYETTKKEKEKITTWWIRRYSNADNKEVLGILINDERHYYTLQKEEFSNSIEYIINQISEFAKDIKNKEDLENLELVIITDNKLASEYANNFIPHNKIKVIKNPIIYNDTILNMFMVSGFITGNSLINLIYFWCSLSVFEKIFNIVIGGLFALSFIFGLICLSYIIYESLKKTTK